MEFGKVMRLRQSTRAFLDTPLDEKQIAYLIEAANLAPVGSKLYRDVHITVIRDRALMRKLCEAAWVRFSSKEKLKEVSGDADVVATDEKCPDLFYGAPVVFMVSHRKQTLQPGIEWANVTSLVSQMHLAATDLGLGSVFMWGALESMRMFPEYDNTALLALPEGFEPLLGLAVGYPAKALSERAPTHGDITVNYL